MFLHKIFMLLYYKVESEKMNCVLVRFILFVIFILFEVIFFVKIYKKYIDLTPSEILSEINIRYLTNIKFNTFILH